MSLNITENQNVFTANCFFSRKKCFYTQKMIIFNCPIQMYSYGGSLAGPPQSLGRHSAPMTQPNAATTYIEYHRIQVPSENIHPFFQEHRLIPLVFIIFHCKIVFFFKQSFDTGRGGHPSVSLNNFVRDSIVFWWILVG